MASDSAVAALCIEAGYVSASRDAVETLVQILQCCKFELSDRFVVCSTYNVSSNVSRLVWLDQGLTLAEDRVYLWL